MTRPESRRRAAGRPSGGVAQRPFGQVGRRYRPIEVISDDQVAAIHEAALASEGRVIHA